MSGLVLLDNARSKSMDSFSFPSPLKNWISLTPSCQSLHLGVFIKSRILFRNDLVQVTPCLELELANESIYAPQLSVFLVKVLKYDKNFLLIYISDNDDLDLMIQCMEYYRLAYGYPILLFTKEEFTLSSSQTQIDMYT